MKSVETHVKDFYCPLFTLKVNYKFSKKEYEYLRMQMSALSVFVHSIAMRHFQSKIYLPFFVCLDTFLHLPLSLPFSLYRNLIKL